MSLNKTSFSRKSIMKIMKSSMNIIYNNNLDNNLINVYFSLYLFL